MIALDGRFEPAVAVLRRRIMAAAVTGAGVLLAAAPYFLAPYAITTLTRILIFALLAASLDLLVGTAGLPSLGHAAYFGVGGYAAGWLASHVTTQAAWQLLGAIAISSVTALVAGLVAVRAQQVFFLVLTLAIAEIIEQLAESWTSVTGGSNGLYGIPATRLGAIALTGVASVYWYVAAVFGACLAGLWLVSASPFGATLRGVRDNEARMRALGYPTTRYKLAVFTVAGAFAGVSGSLLAAQQRLVTPTDLGFTTSALALVAVIIGGSGRLWGACLGAAVVVLVRDTLGPNLGGHGPLVLGLVFVVVVFLLPRGVAGLRRPARPRRGAR